MESGIQSSFIPHDAPITTLPRQGAPAMNRGLSELLLLLAIVLFVSSAALAAAVFLYDQYVQSSSASKLDQLKRAKAAFDPSLIQQLTRLDDRMNSAEQVLVGHVAPSALFDALQQSTLSTVSFSSLNLDIQDAQHMNLKMNGVAQSVNSVALQADLFAKSGIIESPIFSDITREADGVHFTVSAVLNPSMVSYEHLIAADAQAAQTTTNTTQSSAPMQLAPAVPTTQTGSTTPATQTQSSGSPDSTASPFDPRTQ